MKVFFINGASTGLAEAAEVLPGSTLAHVLDTKIGGVPAGYAVRVKRGGNYLGSQDAPLQSNMALKEGDCVTVAPVNMGGGI